MDPNSLSRIPFFFCSNNILLNFLIDLFRITLSQGARVICHISLSCRFFLSRKDDVHWFRELLVIILVLLFCLSPLHSFHSNTSELLYGFIYVFFIFNSNICINEVIKLVSKLIPFIVVVLTLKSVLDSWMDVCTNIY